VSEHAGAERGFTLLEVLIVGVIMVIVAGITIPAVQSKVFSDPLKQAALSVAGFTRKAEQAGRESMWGCRLVIAPAQNTIAIHLATGSGKAAGPLQGPAGSTGLQVLRLPEGIRLHPMGMEQSGAPSGEPVSVWVNNRGMIDSFVLHISDKNRTMILRNQPFLNDIQISLDDPGTRGG
jgi:prepilin-type N-terminal cleavage/methylation domain-containing protein